MKKQLLFILLATLICIVSVIYLLFSDSTKQPDVLSQNNSSEIIREKVPANAEQATFAAGCFWCTEAAFQETNGVTNAISGYAGGEEFNPTYEAVYKETTNHRESIRIYYDPTVITYEQLLGIFWQNIDPTDPDGQFVDKGFSYTTAIFYHNDTQKIAAEKSKLAIQNSGKFTKPITTKIIPFSTFYEAEQYHQDFYLNSAERYKNYSDNSGRKEFKESVWQEIQNSQ